MDDWLDQLREAIRRPLPLAYHPLYRFYEGGSLTRAFRGLPGAPRRLVVGGLGGLVHPGQQRRSRRPSAGHEPGRRARRRAGRAQRHRRGPARGDGRRAVRRTLGSHHRRAGQAAVAAGQVPLHAHPTRAWAREHLGSPFGKTEAWILLDTPGDGREPAYAGIGFVPGIDRDWFADAVRRHDNRAIRGHAPPDRASIRARCMWRMRASRTTSGRGSRSSRSRSPATTS